MVLYKLYIIEKNLKAYVDSDGLQTIFDCLYSQNKEIICNSLAILDLTLNCGEAVISIFLNIEPLSEQLSILCNKYEEPIPSLCKQIMTKIKILCLGFNQSNE